MKISHILVALIFSVSLATSAFGTGKVERSTAELEFEHTKLTYDDYIGQREEQKANMLELTIGRLERINKMHKDSGVKNVAFERDMKDFRASLYVVRHMNRARDASRVNKEGDVVKEMTQACRYADQTTYLDPHL